MANYQRSLLSTKQAAVTSYDVISVGIFQNKHFWWHHEQNTTVWLPSVSVSLQGRLNHSSKWFQNNLWLS